MHAWARHFITILILLGSIANAAEPIWTAGKLSQARARLLHGNYEEARSAYEQAAQDDPTLKPGAAIGVSRSHREVGDNDKALSVLNAALKELPKDADLLAERADLYFHTGAWDKADADVKAALSSNGDHLLAKLTLARLLRDRGELDAADEAMRSIVRYYTKRSYADMEIVNPEELRIVSLAGAENARWHNLSRQFAFILNTIIADALKSDNDYWPAEQLAGELLLEKYNRPDAMDAFDKVLAINPKAADPLVGKASAALQTYDFGEANRLLDEALTRNPNHVKALCLKADVEMMSGEFASALAFAQRASKVNPRSGAVLARLAGVYQLLERPADFDSIVKRAEEYDKKPTTFYSDLADILDNRKLYDQAKKYYRKAADYRPMVAEPRTGLGMLYLRLGDEEKGRELLTTAFEGDPFNVRVANSLKALRHLDEYATMTTEHYILRYDAENDELLAKFLAEFLETTHAELKQQFDYEPPEKILIEVFKTHEMFSGRTVGLPDLHTIGACSGKVVAMASPKAKGVNKPFNWGRVIRHELTHIFNLTQTKFQCPHWLTEGLAVRNEEMARPYLWTTILRDKFEADQLFNLDTVMMGFVRPQGPDEWTLAYCQSQLYVEYMVKTHGQESIGKILAAFADGLSTPAAIKRVCNVDVAEFEDGYRRYLATIVKPHQGLAEREVVKPMTYAELEKAHEESPDDLEIAARLAEQQLRRDKPSEARELADTILSKQPGHAGAAIVKARLLERAGDGKAAISVLNDALAKHPDHAKLLITLAKLHIDNEQPTVAAKLLEHGREVAPLDGNWLEQLAQLYSNMDDSEKLSSVLKEIVEHDPDELTGRLKLAHLALDAKLFVEAKTYAGEAIQIDVTNVEAQNLLLAALKGLNEADRVEELKKRFDE